MSLSSKYVSVMKRKYLATVQPTCYLCGYEILKPDVQKPRIMRPNHYRDIQFSVDHLVPLSCKRDHNLNNLKAAHKKCNELRGSKPINPKIRTTCKNTIEQILRFAFCSVDGGNNYLKRFNKRSSYKLSDEELNQYINGFYEYSSSSSTEDLPDSSSTSSL